MVQIQGVEYNYYIIIFDVIFCMNKFRPYAAELVGTSVLSFAVVLSVGSGQQVLITPVVAALTLGLFVYSMGHVSGCHLNPAVTIALSSLGKISGVQAVKYIVAQFAGVGLTLGMLLAIFEWSGEFSFVAPESLGVFIAEAIGTAVFVFGVMAVVSGKVEKTMSGIVVGGSLLLGIFIAASMGTEGILNPAVAVVLRSVSASYIVGAIVGALMGAWAYQAICVDE